MRELAALLNTMRDDGVVLNYALFGATVQMRYTEPVATLDADVLVALPDPERIDVLAPEREAIRVGAWPVQFVPVFSELTREALDEAETADFEGVPLHVVGATHLAVIALSVGRPKDYTRILALLESDATSADAVAQLASRHGLSDAWQRFRLRFLE